MRSMLLSRISHVVKTYGLIQQTVRYGLEQISKLEIHKRNFSKTFTKITHVIFDLDGLLIESVYNTVIRDLARQFDKDYTKEIQVKILGMTEKDTCKTLVQEMKLNMSVDEFRSLYRKKLKGALHSPALRPGAKELIKYFHEKKVPMGLATSGAKHDVDIRISRHRALFKLFSHFTCAGSDPAVKHGKPAPDVFLVCASRFVDKPCPEDCLVFEDAPNGVKAASKAGMQTVLVPPKVVGEEHRKMATLCLSSLADFQPELFGLPAKSQY